MNRLTGFSGRVGRLGFVLVYIPIFVVNMIGLVCMQHYVITDYFSLLRFDVLFSDLCSLFIFMVSIYIYMVETPNSRWFNYLGLLMLGSIYFYESIKLFLLHPGPRVPLLGFFMFYFSLFIIFCSGYVRRLHDLGWRVSPAAKAVFVAYILIFCTVLLGLAHYERWIALVISTMYFLSVLTTGLLSIIFCVSLPFACFKSGTKGPNSFGDEPKDLLGI